MQKHTAEEKKTEETAAADYSMDSMWAYNGTGSSHEADLFLIGPTTYGGDEESINMPLDDEGEKESFLGALNMERGIYEDSLDMYAPYYRQGSLSAIDAGRMEESYEIAYEDVSAAFEYHIYDYQFFYRNLQENVKKRVEAYLG